MTKLTALDHRMGELKDIFFTRLRPIIDKEHSHFGPKEKKKKPKYGWICSSKYVLFNDGSQFEFGEYIDNNRKITNCSYRYIRAKTGFFFQYEDEGDDMKITVKKYRHHWHVGIIENEGLFPILLKQKIDNEKLDEELFENLKKEFGDHPKDGLHYDAPEDMNLERFLCIIVANFFDKEENFKEILKYLKECMDDSINK